MKLEQHAQEFKDRGVFSPIVIVAFVWIGVQALLQWSWLELVTAAF